MAYGGMLSAILFQRASVKGYGASAVGEVLGKEHHYRMVHEPVYRDSGNHLGSYFPDGSGWTGWFCILRGASSDRDDHMFTLSGLAKSGRF